ncbi:MAG: hypothetical protein ACK5O7_05510 [Holosporales bacterium]
MGRRFVAALFVWASCFSLGFSCETPEMEKKNEKHLQSLKVYPDDWGHEWQHITVDRALKPLETLELMDLVAQDHFADLAQKLHNIFDQADKTGYLPLRPRLNKFEDIWGVKSSSSTHSTSAVKDLQNLDELLRRYLGVIDQLWPGALDWNSPMDEHHLSAFVHRQKIQLILRLMRWDPEGDYIFEHISSFREALNTHPCLWADLVLRHQAAKNDTDLFGYEMLSACRQAGWLSPEKEALKPEVQYLKAYMPFHLVFRDYYEKAIAFFAGEHNDPSFMKTLNSLLLMAEPEFFEGYPHARRALSTMVLMWQDYAENKAVFNLGVHEATNSYGNLQMLMHELDATKNWYAMDAVIALALKMCADVRGMELTVFESASSSDGMAETLHLSFDVPQLFTLSSTPATKGDDLENSQELIAIALRREWMGRMKLVQCPLLEEDRKKLEILAEKSVYADGLLTLHLSKEINQATIKSYIKRLKQAREGALLQPFVDGMLARAYYDLAKVMLEQRWPGQKALEYQTLSARDVQAIKTIRATFLEVLDHLPNNPFVISRIIDLDLLKLQDLKSALDLLQRYRSCLEKAGCYERHLRHMTKQIMTAILLNKEGKQHLYRLRDQIFNLFPVQENAKAGVSPQGSAKEPVTNQSAIGPIKRHYRKNLPDNVLATLRERLRREQVQAAAELEPVKLSQNTASSSSSSSADVQPKKAHPQERNVDHLITAQSLASVNTKPRKGKKAKKVKTEKTETPTQSSSSSSSSLLPENPEEEVFDGLSRQTAIIDKLNENQKATLDKFFMKELKPTQVRDADVMIRFQDFLNLMQALSPKEITQRGSHVKVMLPVPMGEFSTQLEEYATIVVPKRGRLDPQYIAQIRTKLKMLGLYTETVAEIYEDISALTEASSSEESS